MADRKPGRRRRYDPKPIVTAIAGRLDKMDRDVVRVVSTVAFQALADAQTRSPVDRGFYRGSHEISIGDVPGGTIGAPPKQDAEIPGQSDYFRALNSQAAANNLSSAAAKLSDVAGRAKSKVSIYLSNHMVYAGRLEDGHSQQAPGGVYRLVRQDAARNLARGVAKLKADQRKAAGSRRRGT